MFKPGFSNCDCLVGGLLYFMKIIIIVLYISLWIFALFNFSSRCFISLPTVFLNEYPEAFYSNFNHTVLSSLPTSSKFCFLNKNQFNLQSTHSDLNEELSTVKIEKFYLLDVTNPVELGGIFKPTHCVPFQKVAIIIPYRNRYPHLKILLNRLHSMLRLQQIWYRIYVIEQGGTNAFNRGMIMNVGVKEALKDDIFDCFIFHDVDLIPQHDRNIYLCDNHARHLVSAMDEMRFHVMYYNYVGGVLALSRKSVFRMNGFSNVYWGWGGEDDDASARTEAVGLKISRPPEKFGRYKMIRHVKSIRGDGSYGLFVLFRNRQFEDGLNNFSADSYKILHTKLYPLYTNVTVLLNDKIHRMTTSWKNSKPESLYWFLHFFYP